MLLSRMIIIILFVLIASINVYAFLCEKGDLIFRAKDYSIPQIPPWTLHTGVYGYYFTTGNPFDMNNHIIIESVPSVGCFRNTLYQFANLTSYYGSFYKGNPNTGQRNSILFYANDTVNRNCIWDFIIYKGPNSYRCDGLAEYCYEQAGIDIVPGDTSLTIWPDLQMSYMFSHIGAAPSIQVSVNGANATVTVDDGTNGSGLTLLEVLWDGQIQQTFTQDYAQNNTYNLSGLPTDKYILVKAYDQAGNVALTSWGGSIGKVGSVSGGSCPFIYHWDGEKFVFDNDIMPAGNPNKYLDYYLLMKPLTAKDNKYCITISDELDEVSSMDEIKLIQVDYPKGINIAPTPEGKILTYSNPILPVLAKDKDGENWLNEMSGKDNGYYRGHKGDYLELEYPADSLNKYSKLILSTDEKSVKGDLCDVRGGIFMKSLHVKILNKDNKWEEIGVVHPHMKWDIYAIKIPDSKLQITNGNFKVRIEWTETHKIDYCWLDNSKNDSITATELPLIKAKHNKSGDVMSKLLKTDNDYAVTELNDKIELEFQCYELPKEERSFIFMSHGFYIDKKK